MEFNSKKVSLKGKVMGGLMMVAMTLMVSVCQAQTTQMADSLYQRGRELTEEGKFVEARACQKQAMDIRKQLLGEVSEDYITAFFHYALTFRKEENYTKAAELQESAMALCAKLEKPHPKLDFFAQQTGYTYYELGNKEKAIQYWDMALPLTEKFSKLYETLLSGLGMLYEEIGDKQNLSRIMTLMEELLQHKLTLPCDEPGCMLERAQYYASKGDQAKAKECYLAAFGMPMDDTMKVKLHEAYAQFMAMYVNDRATAADYQEKAVALRATLKGKDADYANAAYNAALYHSLARTKEHKLKALTFFEEAIVVYQGLGNGEKVAVCRRFKGNTYMSLRDYANAKECFQEALAYYEANDKESKYYPFLIERMAAAEKFSREFDASIAHYRQAMGIYEARGMMKEYADAENGLKMCYAYAKKDMDEASDGSHEEEINAQQMQQLDKLIADEKANLELTQKFLGKLAYASSLGVIANCYAMKHDYPDAVEYYKLYIESLRDAVRDEFRLQNEHERMATWNEEAHIATDIKELLVELPESHQDLEGDIAALAYDAELLSKGILLNSSIEFEKLLYDNGDQHLSDIYKQIKTNKETIEKLRKEASTDADLESILALTQENQRLQIELNKSCQEMEDFTQYISYDWKNVQASMNEQDVSIEFSAVNLGIANSESHMMALVLTKDMPHPVAVMLWNEDKLLECSETPFYQAITDSLFKASFSGRDKKEVIKEMRTKLATTDTPFKLELSLYLQYIENKPDTSKRTSLVDQIIWLKYPQLMLQDDVLFKGPEVGEIIWGQLTPYLKDKKRIFFSADGVLHNIGIEYLPYNGKSISEQFEVYRLSSTKELCHHREKTKLEKAALFGDINYGEDATQSAATLQSLATLRGAGAAGGFADLSNTLREVDGILSILKSKGVKDAERFRDTEASKQTFMGLTDSKVNILHIATHGLYQQVKKPTDAESMQNSRLAFAGANLDEEGIVTAADIATMNLRKCDLVVLSACETGLGKLGDDGMFGLQRGFKNAGVHTLMMSLKNVYDNSTADLMISFYKHLMNGATKREALVNAQQDIRAKGFNDPKYWATFILLDAF